MCRITSFSRFYIRNNAIYPAVVDNLEGAAASYRHGCNWLALRIVHINRHIFGMKGVICAAVKAARDSVPALCSRRVRKRSAHVGGGFARLNLAAFVECKNGAPLWTTSSPSMDAYGIINVENMDLSKIAIGELRGLPSMVMMGSDKLAEGGGMKTARVCAGVPFWSRTDTAPHPSGAL